MPGGRDLPNKTLKWCFKLKDGLKIVEPNENLAKSYLKEAKSSLLRAQKNYEEKDLLWTTVVAYYAEYYALYSFLQRIGIKCENHTCSILAVGIILGKERVETINQTKRKRIDAQYYMKVGKEMEVEIWLNKAKIFVSMFEDLTLNITDEEIKKYRDILIALV
jgi:uncharacterized protein (UPF0332 family)